MEILGSRQLYLESIEREIRHVYVASPAYEDGIVLVTPSFFTR